ncbi:MAG: DUF6268 family outer membrane beta-barrel protein [Verrucomicrobiota bacterium]|nr:DUF6268 family outer membrane beta-barrel protein [Verrucomicrobiota bacterium]
MKSHSSLAALLCACCLTSGFAQTVETNTETTEGASSGSFPFEFETQVSLVSDSELRRGYRDIREVDEDYSMVRFVYTPRLKYGILRLGVAYERFGFGMREAFEVPRGLQSLAAVVGFDTRLGDSILVRFEAQPGVYTGTRFDFDDFHVPFILGGTYLYSSSVQFVLGISVDYERSYPVFPGGGVRWRFAPQWVLNAVMPTPRLEYELTKDVTLYAGADLKGSTFRVDNRFGAERGNSKLNNAVLTYSEIRTGAGLAWKLSPGVKVSVEGGIVPYQNFDFHRTNVRYHQESVGAYGSVAINASF